MNMFDIDAVDSGELAESKQTEHNKKPEDDDNTGSVDEPLDDACVSPVAAPALTASQPENASPARTMTPGLLDHEIVVTAEDNDAAVSQDLLE